MPFATSTKEKAFKRNRNVINRTIRGTLAKKKFGIVHGTRATNAQLPSASKRKTVDWDIFVKKNPKKRAIQIEKALDERFREDIFEVKRGVGSPGVKVFKVKSKITGEGFADLATTNRKVPSVSIRGVRFATLKDQNDAALRNIKKPELKFRRKKDLNLLKRINKFENKQGRFI